MAVKEQGAEFFMACEREYTATEMALPLPATNARCHQYGGK